MIAVTSLKHWIHLRRSSRWPPTSNMLPRTHTHTHDNWCFGCIPQCLRGAIISTDEENYSQTENRVRCCHIVYKLRTLTAFITTATDAICSTIASCDCRDATSLDNWLTINYTGQLTNNQLHWTTDLQSTSLDNWLTINFTGQLTNNQLHWTTD